MAREMKDSGVEWIGEIPKDWKFIKLKNIMTFLNGYAFEGDNFSSEGSFSVIKIGDIFNNKIDLKNSNKISLTDSEEKNLEKFIIKKNDILIAMSGATVGKLAFINDIKEKAYINQRVGILRNNKNIASKYLFYSLLNDMFLKYIYLLSIGSAQPNISSVGIENYTIVIPPLKEQEKIVNYLDKKVIDIDLIIEKTKTTIEDYKKYKQSIITEAVTKGLNSNAEMKDSEIEWIEKIPKHWEIQKGKNCLKYIEKPIKSDDKVITCFRDGEVTLRCNRREDGFTISTKEIGYQGIDIGDLVVHGMDGFAGAIGISDSRGKASPVLNVLETSNNKKYIMYYLRNMAYNGVFLALSTGIRIRTCDTNWKKLKELPYILPPLEEQQQIAEYLDKKIANIDNLIAKKESLISEMEEYKKSLIYECVTGKKEII